MHTVCRRETKRWPLAYFYNCLNIAGINSQVVFTAKHPEWAGNKSHCRRIFLQNLGMQLLQPWLEKRAQNRRLCAPTRRALQACGLPRPVPDVDVEPSARKRKRCHICPSSLDRKTVERCDTCHEPCCNDHKTVSITCTYCAE